MDTDKISRRDFLKLLPLALLLQSHSPLVNSLSSFVEDPDLQSKRPNILVLVFDAFSAKHASFLGYHRATTPNLSRFANHATVYHHHYAGGNFTLPGTASLLTGTYPWTHRGMHLFGTVRREFIDRNLFSVFNPDYYTTTFTHNALVRDLFDQFQRHIDRLIPMSMLALRSEAVSGSLFPKDYTTSFWGERVVRGSGLEQPSSLFLSLTHIAEDFKASTPDDLMRTYTQLYPRGLPTHSVGLFFLLEDAIDWIKQQVTVMPRPFLAYYHLLPPHEPYRPREEFIGRFDDGWHFPAKPIIIFPQGMSETNLDIFRRQYDEYLAYVDSEFGHLYDSLERSGILDNTYLVVTSDHGQLFERGIHGHVTSTLYDPVVHIPLLIHTPGQRERQDILTFTSTVDVLPTLAHFAGKPIPDWSEGRILPPFAGDKLLPERRLYMVEAKSNPKTGPLKHGTVAMIGERYKLISYFGYGDLGNRYELYDLKNDPDEMEDLSKTEKRLAPDLEKELANTISQKNRVT